MKLKRLAIVLCVVVPLAVVGAAIAAILRSTRAYASAMTRPVMLYAGG